MIQLTQIPIRAAGIGILAAFIVTVEVDAQSPTTFIVESPTMTTGEKMPRDAQLGRQLLQVTAV